MSCPHGNWDCDTCQEVSDAYDNGYKDGRKDTEAIFQRVRKAIEKESYKDPLLGSWRIDCEAILEALDGEQS